MLIEEKLKRCLKDALAKMNVDIDISKIVIERSKEKVHGDFASNIAMQLARELKKNPLLIAEDIVNNLDVASFNKVEIARKYSKLILFVAVLSFPLGVYLYCTAYELIYLFYGNQWNAAIPCFKILALSIPLQVILCTSGSVFQAANATKPLFYVGLINTFVTVSGFLISCFYFATLEAIALSWTITTSINFVSSYITLYGLVLKTSPFVVLKALINPVFCSQILMLAYLFIPDIDNWVYSLLVKTILAIFVTVVFVQLSGIYDFYDKIHHLITKNK